MTLDEAIDQEEEIVRDNELYSRVVREGKFSTEATRRLALKRAEQFDEIAAEHRQLAKWLKELKAYKGLSTYNRPNKCNKCEYEDSEYYCDDCIWNFVDKFKQREANADDK